MISEAKIIFDKIKSLRYLLREGVGENDIKAAIDNQEWVYLYYSGDDNVEKGYRTVRPMVLGKTKEGNVVLRAWQDKGRSQSLGAHSKRKHLTPVIRQDHEQWTDTDGMTKPGWRLFRVDKISKLYPTGDRFVDEEGRIMIPPKYRENGDDQMGGGIIAQVTTKAPVRTVFNVGDLDKPKVTTKGGDSVFAKQTGRWKSFYHDNKGKREMTPETIKKLYDIAVNVRKEKVGDLFVAMDKSGRYFLKLKKYKDRFPQGAIVGDLRQLYDELVLNNREKTAAEDDFIKKEKQKMETSLNNRRSLFKGPMK